MKTKIRNRFISILLGLIACMSIFLFPSIVKADTCLNISDNPCWLTKASMPTSRRGLGVAADSLGRIYVVGGYDGSNFVNTLEMYNPANDTWVTKTPAPIARGSMGFTFNPVNGKFYFAGGYNEGVSNDFYEYDPATDSWIVRTSMPTARQGLRLVAGSNGKLYAAGGMSGSSARVDVLEEYNPATDTWVTKTPMPNALMSFGFVAVQNGKLYAIGGIDSSSLSVSSVYEYNPLLDIWTTKVSMPTPREDPGASINASGNIYIIGGRINGNITNVVEEYNPVTDSWTSRTSLPTEIYSPGAALGSNGKVHVMGGQTNSNDVVNTNYAGFIPVQVQLPVPYFSQNALPWGPSEYDHTKKLGINGIQGSMDRWGCAVTSVAMVLNYHNMKQFIDGTSIDPGSLNEWLKQNKGYSYGYGSDGWYSSINWDRIGSLTQDLKAASKSTYTLEYHSIRSNPTPQTKTILDHDLTVGDGIKPFPDILWVNNSSTTSHFVVAKGISNNIYSINDPEWNYPDLSSFNNSYMQIGRYVPSHTDLSYLTVVVNPDVEILVTDFQGRKTGKLIHNGITDTYNEIPDATYGFEAPLSNPGSNGIPEQLGTGVNSFLLPKPETGIYTVTFSSNEDTFYTANISTTEKEGGYNLETFQGSVAPNIYDISKVNYFKEAPSTVKKDVTFASTLADIKELRELGLLNFPTGFSLTALVTAADKLHDAGKDKPAKELINVAIKLIEKNEKVNPIAREILLYDFNKLKILLQN